MASTASGALDPAPSGAARVRAIRRWWRAAHPPPGWLKRLEPVYYVLFVLVFIGPLFYGVVSTALAQVATPHALTEWGPAVVLVGLVALVRWGAVQGPVVFSVPDVAQLLLAPLPRAALALGRLRRSLAIVAGSAAVVAGLALVGVAGDGRGVAVERAAGFVVAGVLLALTGCAGASLVQGSPRWDAATRRLTWPAYALAAALVALAGAGGASGRGIALWCGPWGWAIAPLAAGGAWPLALLALALLALAATTLCLARRGVSSTERYMVRAEARGGAIAAVYAFNTRYVRRSLSVAGAPAAARLRAPRRPWLAVPWRDAAAALGMPRRLGEAVALAAGGTLLCLLDGGRPAAVAAGALALYAGAMRLLEPLRAETDKPDRARALLRISLGRALGRHALLPTVVVALSAAAAALGCALAGALPAHGAAAAALAIVATPAIVLCAALNARRAGQVSSSVVMFVSADTSGFGGVLLFLWLVLWPALAVAAGTVPVSVVIHGGTATVPQLVLLLAAATGALLAGLRWERYAP